jgi:hypothetical protein
MRSFKFPAGLTEEFTSIGIALNDLANLLQQDSFIDEGEFNGLVGDFTKSLNCILGKYPDLDEDMKDEVRSHLLYLRQVQNYLVFLLRFPDILNVPHHCEIEQTLDFILNREDLLENKYKSLALHEKKLFQGDFREKLEACLEHKSPANAPDEEP